jgi:hypothetical protein
VERQEDEQKTNVDVSDAGTVEPKDPTWEKPSVSGCILRQRRIVTV